MFTGRARRLLPLFGVSSLLFTVSLAAAAAAPVTIVEGGKSTYSICISGTASPSERRGAGELQRFLAEMSGVKLPIVTDAGPAKRDLILVGRSRITDAMKLNIDYAGLGPEGFALKTSGRRLVIAGGRLRGSMYGVYTFLEKLGCRWFTSEVSRIPTMRTIRIQPLDETGKPAFENRDMDYTEARDKDWAARNRLNGNSLPLDASTGGKVEYYPFVHTFSQLVPPARYFKEHPEYFSLIDGKRRAEGQLCLTNPEVLRISVAAVERWIQEHPEATIYSVSQNDGGGWCECDQCRRVEQEEGGAHSGPLLRFVNALAAQIEKTHPDKLIDTLAYHYTEEPPAHVRPRPNVRIRLCPIGVCEAHPYEQCKYSAYFVKHLRAWSHITNQLYIWHYNTDFEHYLAPFPDFDELAADIPMYKRYGVVGMFMESDSTAGGGGENAWLRAYVMAKLLWNPEANAAALIGEFHRAYYGRAAGPMLEYFELMHRGVRMPPRGRGQHMWIFEVPGRPYLEPDFVEKANRLFDEAERLAENDAVRRRVRKARLSVEEVEVVRAMKFRLQGDTYAPPAGVGELWKTFLAHCRQFGVTDLSNGYDRDTLDHADQHFARLIHPYRVTTIENARIRTVVAPELDGRVICLIDKRTGRNVLETSLPGAPHYPNGGGATVAAFRDFTRLAPYVLKWQVESAGSQAMTLVGRSDEGLKVTRRLEVRGAGLHTETVAENAGGMTLAAALLARIDTDPGLLDNAAVSYRRRDGTPILKRMIEPEHQPGSEGFDVTYAGDDRPNGQWRVVNRETGSATVNRFSPDQVARCLLSWTLRDVNRVTLAVWSENKSLAPGERVKLDADYDIE